MSAVVVASGVDCTLATNRCVPPIAGSWVYKWSSYVVNEAFPSFDAAVADMQARLNAAYAPYTLAYTWNDQFPSLSQTVVPPSQGYVSGTNWSVNAVYGVNNQVSWNNPGTATLQPPISGSLQITAMIAQRYVGCPKGYAGGPTYCYITNQSTTKQPDKSRKPGCHACRPSVADPIDVADGFMWQRASDVDDDGGPPLERNYNSSANVITNGVGAPAEGFGIGWRSNYSRRVRYSVSGSLVAAYVERPNGQILYFTKGSSGWASDPDVHSVLTEVDDSTGAISGWSFFDEDSGDAEAYSSLGRLMTITHRNGRSLALFYDANDQLITVTDDWGRSLHFTYLAVGSTYTGQVQTVTDNAGHTWTYSYSSSNYDLLRVTAPDGNAVVYYYDSPVSAALTGIGYVTAGGAESRYSWFTYGNQNRATQSYEAGNVNLTSLTYNSDGTVSVTDLPSAAGSRTVTYSFDLQQGVAKLTSVSGVCGASCPIKSARYDGNGNQTSTTDFNGVTNNTSYSADGAGLPTQFVQAVGRPEQRTIQTDWDVGLRLPVERRTLDASNHLVAKTDWVYNTPGWNTARCDVDPAIAGATTYPCGSNPNAPVGVRQWRYTYCTAADGAQCPLTGLLLSVDGPRTDVSDVTSYAYYLATDESGCGTAGGACHRAGDLYQVTNALGQITTSVAYDKNGRVVRQSDTNGVITDLTYSPRGWLLTRTVRVNANGSASSADATTTLTYTPYGAVASITDPDGVVINYGYDAAHRLTRITDALGNYVQYTLDAAGNKTAEQTYDSNGTLRRSLSRTYNTLGQLTQVTDGLSHAIFNASYTDSYDANGNLVHTADALGVQRKQGYDGLNRLITTIDNYNGTDPATQNTQSAFAYDANDRLEGVSDPDGLNTTYSYDGLGNATGVQSPDTGSTAYVYDTAGNVIQRTDAKGVVSHSTYDALNRRTATTYADGTLNVAYAYDEPNSVTGCPASYSVGRLTRIIETAVTTVYCYDAHGNVTRKSQTQGTVTDVTAYGYTLADRLASTLTPAGTSIQYSRDAAGRISGVTALPPGTTGAGAGNVVTAISYLPFGPIASYTLGNGQTVTRTYDANYALTDVVSPTLNLHFARDAMGNITALGNAAGANPATETYTYDPLYRLTGLYDASNNPEETYTYSKTGDRLSKTGNGLATGTYTYQPGTHHLTAIGNAARTYDANGNTTGSTIGGDTFGYGYNARNRMTIVQRDGSTVGTYTYNALGQRTAKVATFPAASSLRFAYDEASQLIGEYGSSSRDYVWLGDLPVATVDTTGGVSTVSYVHADGLNTPRAVADASGNTVWQLAYQGSAFGEQVATSSNGFSYGLRFPGQYFDVETGLNYNVHRYYESATGRYDQPDPMGLAAGPSLFAYVGSDPLSYVDPLGLDPHYYHVYTPICWGCSAGDAFEAMRHFSAPGAPYAETGTHDLTLTGGNPITQIVDPCRLKITNITRPGHIFGGQVEISIVAGAHGEFGADIVGSGEGPNAWLNQETGPLIFQWLTANAFLYANPDINNNAAGF